MVIKIIFVICNGFEILLCSDDHKNAHMCHLGQMFSLEDLLIHLVNMKNGNM